MAGRTCWGTAFCQRPLGWRLHVPSEHVSTWAHQPCALAAPGAPRVPARPRAARPRLGGLPTPRGCSPGVSRPLRAARGCGRGFPHTPGAERGAETSGRRTSAGRARPPGCCQWPTSPTGAAGGGEMQGAAALGRSQAAGRAGARG